MNIRTRVGPLPPPIFAGRGLSAKEKKTTLFGIYSHSERNEESHRPRKPVNARLCTHKGLFIARPGGFAGGLPPAAQDDA